MPLHSSWQPLKSNDEEIGQQLGAGLVRVSADSATVSTASSTKKLSGRHWQACVFVETSARDPVGIRIPIFEGGDGFDNAVDECRLSVCFLARKPLRSDEHCFSPSDGAPNQWAQPKCCARRQP
jgi:hypothetical protein